jgi:hypothetical protein
MTTSFIPSEYNDLYTTVAKMIKGKQVTAENVIYLTGIIMEVVEEQVSMTESEEIEFVTDALKEFVRVSAVIPEEDKEMVYHAIQFLVPGAIELILAATKGKLNINVPSLSSCASCFGTKSAPTLTTAKDLVDTNIRSVKFKKSPKSQR